jgi:hypothetical protein
MTRGGGLDRREQRAARRVLALDARRAARDADRDNDSSGSRSGGVEAGGHLNQSNDQS